MIPHSEFGKLRLSNFIEHGKITPLKNWSFIGEYWLGESYGFTEWLRLENDPNTLRSLAIDFATFPNESCSHVLAAIDIPLAPGMSKKEIEDILGKPVEVNEFMPDRKTYSFIYQNKASYDLSCTVLNEGGLTYLVVMVRN